MFLRKRIYPVPVAAAIMFVAGLFALAIMTTAASAQGFDIKYNFGLERGDYRDFDLAQPVWEHCRDACAAESACVAFTYTIPIAGANGRPAHCWLKNVVNRGGGNDWCITGIKQGGGGGSSCGSDYAIQAPSSVAAYSKVNIRFSFRGSKPTGQSDWIGIIGPGKTYNAWVWVKDTQGCDVVLTAPAPGDYEIQYILPGDHMPVAARSYLRVQ